MMPPQQMQEDDDKQYVPLPDGSYLPFPADATDDEINAELQKHAAARQPVAQKPPVGSPALGQKLTDKTRQAAGSIRDWWNQKTEVQPSDKEPLVKPETSQRFGQTLENLYMGRPRTEEEEQQNYGFTIPNVRRAAGEAILGLPGGIANMLQPPLSWEQAKEKFAKPVERLATKALHAQTTPEKLGYAGAAVLQPIGLGEMAAGAGEEAGRGHVAQALTHIAVPLAAGEIAGREGLPPEEKYRVGYKPTPETPPAVPPEAMRTLPRVGDKLDAVAQRIFRQNYDDLSPEKQKVVIRNTPGGEMEAERRVTVGQSPTGMERRAENLPLPREASPAAQTLTGRTNVAPEPPVRAPAPSETMPRVPDQRNIGWEPPRRGQPSAGERPPPPETPVVPPTETDPLKIKFPDPAVRQHARINGEAAVDAAKGDMDALAALTALKNWQVRQAAINAGIDLGTRHVGSRFGLGPEQVSRQDLIDQMIQKGHSPSDIVQLAQRENIPYQKPMPIPAKRMSGFWGMKPIDVIYHELGHAIIAILNGIEQYGITSHRYPGTLPSTGASTLLRIGQFRDINGNFSKHLIVYRGDQLAELFAAGAAANELLGSQVSREANMGLRGDERLFDGLAKALDIPESQRGKVWQAAIDRAKAKLSAHPGILDILKEEAGRREENLPVEFHFSEDRVAHIGERVKRLLAEKTPISSEAGSAEAGYPSGQATLAGREGQGAGIAIAPTTEKLKPYSAPKSTYIFELRGGGEPPRSVTVDAVDRKTAFRMVQKQNPGAMEFHLTGMREHPVQSVFMESTPEVGRATREDVSNFSPETRRFFMGVPQALMKDEAEWMASRPQQQRAVQQAFKDAQPSFAELENIASAGAPFGGWWQRFIDTFRSLGKERYAQQMERVDVSPLHEGRLKAIHSSLSGNKAVAQANDAAWIAYEDLLRRGEPTDRATINRVVKNARAISGFNGLDTVKLWKLVNSPEWRGEKPFSGEVFGGSPIEGATSGARKLPSMLGGTAGEGNWLRIVFDTHMKDLFGLPGLTDAQYIAVSMHIRLVADKLGLPAMEAQGQMWGVILGLKQLMKEGMTPQQAAYSYGRDVLQQVGKDYAQTVLERPQAREGMSAQQLAQAEKVRGAMERLKAFGLDVLGKEASGELGKIVESGQQRLREHPMPPINRSLLARSARRIQQNLETRRRLKIRESE